MTERTPTPWRIHEEFPDTIIALDGIEVACSDNYCSRPDKAEREAADAANAANAAFIVKAVNNHDAMDKLLAAAADELNTSPRMRAMDLGNKITEFRRKLQTADPRPRADVGTVVGRS
jgi:hypothetical protein